MTGSLLTESSDRSAKDSNDGSLGVRLLALNRELPLHVNGSQAPSSYEHESTAVMSFSKSGLPSIMGTNGMRKTGVKTMMEANLTIRLIVMLKQYWTLSARALSTAGRINRAREGTQGIDVPDWMSCVARARRRDVGVTSTRS
jgi:hypothetical protein